MILGLKHNIIADGQFDPPTGSYGDPSTSVMVGLKTTHPSRPPRLFGYFQMTQRSEIQVVNYFDPN